MEGNGAVVPILGMLLQFYDHIPSTRIDLGRAQQSLTPHLTTTVPFSKLCFDR